MWPTLYEVQGAAGPIGLHTYGLMVVLGIAGGLLLVFARARDLGLPVERLPLVSVVAVVGGFAGAKVLYAIGVADPASLLSITGGYAWYGGLLGGAAAVLAVSRRMALDPWRLADATAPALALGAALGRLGCFFAGCCHGVPVAQPDPRTALLPDGALGGQVWGHPHFPFVSTEFHGGVARILDVPLYPTQLWQSFGSLALLALLLAVSRFRRFDGQAAALFLILEPLLRIAVESFRGDHRGYAISWTVEHVPSWLPGLGSAGGGAEQVIGVTTSQAIGLGMVALGVAIWVMRRGASPAAVDADVDAWQDDLIDV